MQRTHLRGGELKIGAKFFKQQFGLLFKKGPSTSVKLSGEERKFVKLSINRIISVMIYVYTGT